MTRRLKRTRDFEVALDIRTDDFIAAPRQAQRNWLLNRALKEFSDELHHADQIARTFVPGADHVTFGDREHEPLDDHDIMEDWQVPVMEAMANLVVEAGSNVLEVGLGRCVAADFIQARRPATHTIIECNDFIARRFEDWKRRYAGRDIRLIRGRWQSVVDELAKYDAILFHTYPLNDSEYVEQVAQSATFAEHFFSTAASLLREGGALTYHTNESDSLSRAHQRALFRHFRFFSLEPIEGLEIPDDTRDSTWVNRLLLIRVVK